MPNNGDSVGAEGEGLKIDLAKLVNDPTYSDLKIKCKGGEMLHMHKVIVCQNSKGLSDHDEFSGEPVFYLEELDAAVVRKVLYYLYTGTLQAADDTLQNIDILACAAILEIPSLITKVSDIVGRMNNNEAILGRLMELTLRLRNDKRYLGLFFVTLKDAVLRKEVIVPYIDKIMDDAKNPGLAREILSGIVDQW